MSFTIPDNQPIRFVQPDESCDCGDFTYKQLAQNTDVTQFQIKLDPCGDESDLLTNGNFAAGLTGWVQTGGLGWSAPLGVAVHTGATSSVLTQSVLSAGAFYKVSITVLQITGGTLSVALGGNTEFITNTGVFDIYLHCITGSDFRITANPTVSTDQFIIDDVSVIEVNTDFIFTVRNDAGTVILARYVKDFIDSTTTITDEFTLVENYLTTFHDWGSPIIPNDCYTLCLSDPCINQDGQNGANNGRFFQDKHWTIFEVIATLNIQNNQLEYDDAIGGGSGRADNDAVFEIGKSYDITYTISNIVTTNVQVRMGTALGAVRSTNGTFTDTLVCAGNTTFSILFTSGGAGSNADIDDVDVRFTNITDIQCDVQSNEFKLDANLCTILINACNDETNSFDFRFNASGFSPQARVFGKLRNARYPFDRNFSEDSRGRSSVDFYQRHKTKELSIDWQPEYMLDFLSLLPGFDHFYIDGPEFVVADGEELTLDYDDQLDNFAKFSIDVREKQELVINAKCSPEGTGCNPLVDCLIDPITELCVIDPATGDPVLSLE